MTRRLLARLRDVACALGALAAVAAVPAEGLRLAGLGLAGAALFAADAEARSRSSGGYSRPSTSSRRPSASPSYSRPRTPSVGSGYSRPGGSGSSGGYSRPAAPPSGGWTPRLPSASGGDAAISRRQSVDALRDYRANQDSLRREQERYQRPPVDAPPVGGRSRVEPRYDRVDQWQRERTDYYGGRGWSPPAYAYRSAPSFGMWDGLMLWFLLDNLSRPGSTDFFRNNQGDPGYAAWRAEADRLARDDADLRGKLQALDQRLAADGAAPREPGALPAGVPPGVALAPAYAVERQAPPASGGLGGVWIVVLAGGALLVFLWYWRRRTQAPGAAKDEGGEAMARAPGAFYKPAPFRIGMTVELDPTPFLLVHGKTKVVPPDDAEGRRTSVEALGTLQAGGATLYRLYLPGGTTFVQVHLDDAGSVDECRYFSRIDEVRPASDDEWGFWIDDAEGMIGWPEFQAKDGALYGRVWSPGEQRVAPVEIAETQQDVQGTIPVRHRMMLYAAPIEAPPPAPQAEYVLLDLVETDSAASVKIYAGIDINPAALGLT